MFYRTVGKRILDVLLSGLLLIVLLPVFAAVAVLSKLTSQGPVFFRQARVGKDGRIFKIMKFRTMVPDAPAKGPELTSAGDSRITRVGRWLRHLKLDELPQLWNVLKGEMSLVGPRPEVPSYVSIYNAQYRKVLTVRPGITDSASIFFRWEEELLSSDKDPEHFYRQVVLPQKLILNLEYIARMSLGHDARLILQTVYSVFTPPPKNPPYLSD